MELVTIGPERGQVGGEIHQNLDAVDTQGIGEQLYRLLHEGADRDAPPLRRTVPSQG